MPARSGLSALSSSELLVFPFGLPPVQTKAAKDIKIKVVEPSTAFYACFLFQCFCDLLTPK